MYTNLTQKSYIYFTNSWYVSSSMGRPFYKISLINLSNGEEKHYSDEVPGSENNPEGINRVRAVRSF